MSTQVNASAAGWTEVSFASSACDAQCLGASDCLFATAGATHCYQCASKPPCRQPNTILQPPLPPSQQRTRAVLSTYHLHCSGGRARRAPPRRRCASPRSGLRAIGLMTSRVAASPATLRTASATAPTRPSSTAGRATFHPSRRSRARRPRPCCSAATRHSPCSPMACSVACPGWSTYPS